MMIISAEICVLLLFVIWGSFKFALSRCFPVTGRNWGSSLAAAALAAIVCTVHMWVGLKDYSNIVARWPAKFNLLR